MLVTAKKRLAMIQFKAAACMAYYSTCSAVFAVGAIAVAPTSMAKVAIAPCKAMEEVCNNLEYVGAWVHSRHVAKQSFELRIAEQTNLQIMTPLPLPQKQSHQEI